MGRHQRDAAADFDGDGDLDLAVAAEPLLSMSGAQGGIDVLLNQGNGTFTTVAYSNGGHGHDSGPWPIAVADFDGNAVADFAVTHFSDNEVSVFLGRGDGTFMQPVYYTVGSSPTAVAAKDLNGDGKVDLAIGNFGDTSVSVLMNQGSGAFGAAVAYNLGTAVETIAAGDVDGTTADICRPAFTSE